MALLEELVLAAMATQLEAVVPTWHSNDWSVLAAVMCLHMRTHSRWEDSPSRQAHDCNLLHDGEA